VFVSHGNGASGHPAQDPQTMQISKLVGHFLFLSGFDIYYRFNALGVASSFIIFAPIIGQIVS
jgi:hypothetical protein